MSGAAPTPTAAWTAAASPSGPTARPASRSPAPPPPRPSARRSTSARSSPATWSSGAATSPCTSATARWSRSRTPAPSATSYPSARATPANPSMVYSDRPRKEGLVTQPIIGTATGDDGAVTVEVEVGGKLRAVRLTPRALRYGASYLAETVQTVAARATARANHRAHQVFAQTLGPR